MYTGIAGFFTAVFIAAVYYLIVLFQFPQVPLSSGYALGIVVIVLGMMKRFFAKTKGQKSDSKVLIVAGVVLVVATFIFIYSEIQI